MSAIAALAVDVAEQLDAVERRRVAHAAPHGARAPARRRRSAGARRAARARAARRRPAARGCPCGPRGWPGTARLACPARAPGARRRSSMPGGSSCTLRLRRRRLTLRRRRPAWTAARVAARRCCARRIDPLRRRSATRTHASRPRPAPTAPSRARRARAPAALRSREREAHTHVDGVELVDEVEGRSAGQTPVEARAARHMKAPVAGRPCRRRCMCTFAGQLGASRATGRAATWSSCPRRASSRMNPYATSPSPWGRWSVSSAEGAMTKMRSATTPAG